MQLKKIKTQSVKKTKVKTLTPPFHWTHKWHVMSVKRNMQLIAAIKVNGLFPTRANLTRLRRVGSWLSSKFTQPFYFVHVILLKRIKLSIFVQADKKKSGIGAK